MQPLRIANARLVSNLIDDLRIMQHHIMILQGRHNSFHLIRFPYIILVTQEDHITRSLRQCMLKIPDKSMPAIILTDEDSRIME
jgi:hypothetical protein